KHTGDIGAFRLTSVASAYYKGDEKNPQLQRVYGTAFKTKKELDDYFAMLEEAKKRDHRKLGKELELFVFDDDVGPGLPMFLPRGAVIAEELEKLAKETEFAAGYQRVRTPHIARESLYRKSGHVPYYVESMFPPMQLDEAATERAELETEHNSLIALIGAACQRASEELNFALPDKFNLTDIVREIRSIGKKIPSYLQQVMDRENDLLTRLKALPSPDRYYLKAMNCPHHHKPFAALPRSYRELPLRLAEYGTDYRYEKSGELFGLM